MSNAFRIFCKDSLNFYLSANKLYSTYDGGGNVKENEFINIFQHSRFLLDDDV
ncbi:MAG: hypothetical protein IPN18_14435 [Ignavibacteriales bacterium]|nr:hypothetical protein [Ignavibacteriales bacterium]